MNTSNSSLKWTPRSMMEMMLISDVQLSPDQTRVLFVASNSVLKEDEKGTLLSKIYSAPTTKKEKPTPISQQEASCFYPRWSPDGKWIAFLSDQTGVRQLYLVSAKGGSPSLLASGKYDVQLFAWSPDGAHIAFIQKDVIEQEKKRIKTNASIVYREKKETGRLWLLDPFKSPAIPKALTPDTISVRGAGDFGTTHLEFDWSPDASQIVFTYNSYPGFSFFKVESHLALVNVITGDLHFFPKYKAPRMSPRFSPDGKKIAYLKTKDFLFDTRLAISSTEGSEEKILEETPNGGPFFIGPSILGWNKEGSHLLLFESKGTKFQIISAPIDGSPVECLNTGSFFFKEPSLSLDKTMIAFVGQTPSTPPEAYISPLANFSPTQISSFNASFLTYPSCKTTNINWTAPDGLMIEGLLTYPIRYVKGNSYPLLIIIHGGPAGFFDEVFVGSPYQHPYPIAAFAEEGFLILRPNPRGSCGRGSSFRKANYADFGGKDLLDIMTGVDHLISLGVADPDKLGIMGWSYGGYLTARILTQTDRFKAASAGAGFYNIVSMHGTTDLHTFFTEYMGDFETNRCLYEERSPINSASSISTPCLIQHGTEDKRVPVSQAYEFFHALERCGKRATLVLYPGMEHRISEPHMQLEAMERNLAWFVHYLK